MPLWAAHHAARHLVLGNMPDHLCIRGIWVLLAVLVDCLLEDLLANLQKKEYAS